MNQTSPRSSSLPPRLTELAEQRIEWIKHRGFRVLRQDFRGLKPDEVIALLPHVERIANEHPDETLRELVLFEGVKATRELLDASEQSTQRLRHPRVKTAITGITGIKKLILQAYNKFATSTAHPFDDEFAALDWLVTRDS